MPKESLLSQQEIYDVKTLSSRTKMRILLEIFDLGKNEEENQKRKEKFMDLIREYHIAIIRAKPSKTISQKDITSSDVNQKRLHNKIMEILRSISLSVGLNPNQRKLIEYLAKNREEVERMIGTYFLGHDPGDPKQYSEYQMAHRGESWFTSPPGKEKED